MEETVMDNDDTVWIDGPLHPDLFDGETPTRTAVSLDSLDTRVYKVSCTYYEPVTETHFIVSNSEEDAVQQAWAKVGGSSEDPNMDSEEVEEIGLDEPLYDYPREIKIGEIATAGDLLAEHLAKNGCTWVKE
jgi:hypothetical protein